MKTIPKRYLFALAVTLIAFAEMMRILVLDVFHQ